MEGGRNPVPLGADFRGAGIVEERDVVIDREHEGFRVPRKAGIFGGGIENLDQRRAGKPALEPRIDALHQRRQFRAGVVDQILGRGVARETGEESRELGIARADKMRGCREMGGRVGGIESGFFGGCAVHCFNQSGCPSHVSLPIRLVSSGGEAIKALRT